MSVVNETDSELVQKKLTAKGFKPLLATKFLVSLVLILIILYLSDLQEFLKFVKSASYAFIFLFAVLVFVDRALVVHKWNLLLNVHGVDVPFLHLFKLYSAAQLLGVVLPTTIGGDMFRIYDLRRLTVDTDVVVASIVVERMLGFFCVLMIAFCGLSVGVYLLGESSSKFVGFGWAMAMGLMTGAGCLFLMKSEAFSRYIEKMVERSRENAIIAMVYNVYRRCREYRYDVAVLLKVTAYTFLRQALPIIMNFLLVAAYGIEVSIVELFAIIPLIVLGSRLPISLDGIGVQEGLYVFLFSLIGVSVSQALLLSLTVRVVTILCALPFSFLYFINSRSAIK